MGTRAVIVQRGVGLALLPVAHNAMQISERLRARAEECAKNLMERGQMEVGYYDLHLMRGLEIVDSQVLIN